MQYNLQIHAQTATCHICQLADQQLAAQPRANSSVRTGETAVFAVTKDTNNTGRARRVWPHDVAEWMCILEKRSTVNCGQQLWEQWTLANRLTEPEL